METWSKVLWLNDVQIAERWASAQCCKNNNILQFAYCLFLMKAATEKQIL